MCVFTIFNCLHFYEINSYINFNKNVVQTEMWGQEQLFVYSVYFSVRGSLNLCLELAVMLMQRVLREGNSLAFRKWKSESVGDWCNGKGIESAYFRYDSNFSKCKWSLFAQYRAPSMLLAFKFCQMLHWC